ncbi:hypothetical protein H310_04864 [Aphanomyces invadans]|uniref:Deacetylase sirtuin-type domain-containing protein n=1 Tax=Aphanomyces invadans TaxID=157072 RepID=A0A024UAI0_9STRA|nr:hypothetical protein H310_04864 [Aphanomyces invadans]ETW03386.1 hypothetical protein H310_04864 [Aphanomyces invadans]|eukprot:XP_008867615.1 hypothetical protein H310_04864 [Aphanomyces invadans]
MDAALRAAADDVLSADFLLVAVGAGFSADSGLPVYNDIANVAAYKAMDIEYRDLCDAQLAHVNLPLFYGFWGDCFNMYRDTKGHAGYDILRKWKELVCAKGGGAIMAALLADQSSKFHVGDVTNDPFFVYSSNVDAHFHQHFSVNEVYEIHGTTEYWQCAGATDGVAPCQGTWELPRDFRFTVDKASMLAQLPSPLPPFLQCPQCHGPARPNVLMFGDKSWIPNDRDEARYVAWEAAVEEALVRDRSKRLVVLEIGCGMRVPSVRMECEMVARDIEEKTQSTNQVRHIRINPMDADATPSPTLQHIPSTGLAALSVMDHHMNTVILATDRAA